MTDTLCLHVFETARCEAPRTAPAAEMASTPGGVRPLIVSGTLRENIDSLYVKDNKVYRRRTHYEVNHHLALSDVLLYTESLDRRGTVQQHNPKDDVLYESIADYVSTLRNACIPLGPFAWPSESLRFNKGVAVALHHCPPGASQCASITGCLSPRNW